MWRADGYTEVRAFAHLFKIQRSEFALGMHKETQKKLLYKEKSLFAQNEARQRDRAAGHHPFFSFPTHEDIDAIEDNAVWLRAYRWGTVIALRSLLRRTPLFLVGPSVVEPISNSIFDDVFHDVRTSPFVTDDRFTICAKEIVEVARAAKKLKDKAAAFPLSGQRMLDRMIALRVTAKALLPYEGYALSVRDCDVPKPLDIERFLFWEGASDVSKRSDGNSTGRPRQQEKAAKAFASLFPAGRGNASWKQVVNELADNGVHVSVTTLKRAISQKS